MTAPASVVAAIEAAARRHAAIQYRNVEKWGDLPTVDQDAMRRFVAPLVAAAVPHLTAGLRALASGWVGTHDRGDAYAAEVWQVLDALEREASDA